MTEPDINQRHAEKMRKHQANRAKLMANKTVEKGLLMVHTGPGKGKTSAAMGMAMRTIGHGGKVGIIQFIKGSGNWDTAERRILECFEDQVDFRIMGEGFTWETQDRSRDMEKCAEAWAVAKDWIETSAFDMIILDELNIALRNSYLELEPLLETFANRPKDMHIVVTGRNAPQGLMDAADLVTEMTMIKHPMKQGIKAQPGVEF